MYFYKCIIKLQCNLPVCHAAINAILNKNAEDLEGCTLFTTLFPGHEDAKLIVQAGIREVVYYKDRETECSSIAQIIFTKVGVKCTNYTAYRRICSDYRAIACTRRAEDHDNDARKCHERDHAGEHADRSGDFNEFANDERKYKDPEDLIVYPYDDRRHPAETIGKGYLKDEDYYMGVACLSARRSKDSSRQVGTL